MTQRQVRVGIVGAGYIAGVHSAAWRSVAGTFPAAEIHVELSAVADADPDRAAALARAWGWQDAVGDWTQVTQSSNVDVVDICVPNHLHAEIAIDALSRGKHVICEKPLAADRSHALEMSQAAARSNRLAQVCFYYRVWPAITYAQQLISGGAIGDVQHFRGWMLQDYASNPDEAMGWRADRKRAGAGALGDLGSHITDIARFLSGDIASVCAMTRATVDRGAATTDDIAASLLQFTSGATGVIEASWAMKGHACDLGFDIVGSKGAVRFNWEQSNELQVLDRYGTGPRGFQRILVGPGIGDAGSFVAVPAQGLGYRDTFTIGLGRMAVAISADASSIDPTFDDGFRASEIITAIQRSAQTREWTEVESAGRDGTK